MLISISHTLHVLIAMYGQVEQLPNPRMIREESGRVTLGGMQYWTDHLVCHGWRIQRNVRFGQFRLLKPTNRVAKTGTYETCRQAFDTVFRQPEFPRIHSTVLVGVHGLGRTRNSMSEIGNYVSEAGNFGWVDFGYASTRAEIADLAKALGNVLDQLALLRQEQANLAGSTDVDGIKIHFVAHSLGNIVVRNMLAAIGQDRASEHRRGWHVGRMVMLGPPNHGSALANLLSKNKPFQLIAGSSGKNLGSEWHTLQERLVTPTFEFAIIAGGKGDRKGYNPLLAGDDDLIVRVEETQLSGATDFALVPSIHTYLMNHIESKKMTLRFIQTGFLRSVDQQTRIP